jgi:methionine-rich copper-binding protein CopC
MLKHPMRLFLVFVVVAVFVAAPKASAHSRVKETVPADGATVTTPVSEVTLTFNESVHQKFSSVVVSGPGGVSYSRGHVRVVDNVVHQSVYPLRSGAYAVGWRVVSADDHPVQGRSGFTVALPASLEPATGPPAASPGAADGGRGGAGTWWPWVLTAGGAAAAVALAAGAVRRRRHADRTSRTASGFSPAPCRRSGGRTGTR